MSTNEILIETDRDQIQAVDSQSLKANLNQLIGFVKELGQDNAGGLELDEVSVSVKITPEGKVVLLGDGQSSGAMTLRFKRPQVLGEKLPITDPVNSISYSYLQDLLTANKWQEANQETWNLLCQVLQKSQGSYLSIADINLIPCQTLNTIDQLWKSHSQGRFGFSVQKHIYEANN